MAAHAEKHLARKNHGATAMAVLPPNVSAEDFASAVREFAAAVGADWVFTSDADLELYRDPYSVMRGTERESLASAAVAPASVEQVQQVVRVANKYKTPLFPISTGKNYAYGGASANLSGSVIVDLKRMNRILSVDDERNFALVEPGVSYMDLYRHIQQRGLKVWIDCADVAWGGLVGNALDRGMGYTLPFFRDHANAACGVEVVLANGEVMRTGMGALPKADTWQDYKHGFGPDPSGLFPQGNFGIVTKMGFRLMPQPEHYRTGLIRVPKRRDLIQAIRSSTTSPTLT
jgi:4-cresol dehydrogenase (hydroxylating)